MANQPKPWQQTVADLQASRPGFLMAEEKAIKSRLATLSVSDDRNQQRVLQVFYRYPEEVTEKTYPFVTIDGPTISHNTAVQVSETTYYYTTDTAGMSPEQISRYSEFNYYPSNLGPVQMEALAAGGGFITTESFVPVNLIYQLSTYCRSALHDRQLTALMLTHVTPFRRGFLEVPEDGTIRRFDLLNWRPADVLDQEADYEKRFFRKIYTVQMSAELPASALSGDKKVLTVSGELNAEHQDNLSVNTHYDLTEDFS